MPSKTITDSVVMNQKDKRWKVRTKKHYQTKQRHEI